MEFASCLSYVASGTTQMFQFYYFLKELHEQIVCTNWLVCPVLNFIIPLERVLFYETKSINELKEFFITHCTKRNNMRVFYSLLQRATKKDEAFLTVNYLKKNKRTTNERY